MLLPYLFSYSYCKILSSICVCKKLIYGPIIFNNLSNGAHKLITVYLLNAPTIKKEI